MSGGARRAPEQAFGSAFRPGTTIASVVVVLAVAGAAWLVSGRESTPPRAVATDVPVTLTDLVCAPAEPALMGANESTYAAGWAVVGDASAAGLGTLEAGPVSALAPITLAAGKTSALTGDPASGMAIRGRGLQARGLFGWRSDDAETARCLSPRSHWWFSDAGGGLDHASVLVMTNPDPGPAVVDLRVLGPTGEVNVTVGGKAVTIEPGATVRLDLAQLAPAVDDLTIGVDATRGRVVAFVADRLASGESRGYDWIPAQEEPAAELDIVGIAGAAATRTLWLANPSTNQAVVTVETASANGRGLPTGMTQQTVDPGALLGVDIATVLPGEAFTLRVISTEPIIAGVRSVDEKGSLVHHAPGTTVVGAGALPVVGQTTVHLTTGATDATAQLRAFDANGAVLAEQAVELAAYSTSPWLAPDGSAYVVVLPEAGDIEAAAVYAKASVPVISLPISVSVPEVRPAG